MAVDACTRQRGERWPIVEVYYAQVSVRGQYAFPAVHLYVQFRCRMLGHFLQPGLYRQPMLRGRMGSGRMHGEKPEEKGCRRPHRTVQARLRGGAVSPPAVCRAGNIPEPVPGPPRHALQLTSSLLLCVLVAALYPALRYAGFGQLFTYSSVRVHHHRVGVWYVAANQYPG